MLTFDTIEALKALADKNRLQIMLALALKGELCACQLIDLLQVSGATASRHLSVLQKAGLIQSRKDGRWVYFFIAQDSESFPELLEWVKKSKQQELDYPQFIEKLNQTLHFSQEELCRKQRGQDCCP